MTSIFCLSVNYHYPPGVATIFSISFFVFKVVWVDQIETPSESVTITTGSIGLYYKTKARFKLPSNLSRPMKDFFFIAKVRLHLWPKKTGLIL